MRIARTLAAVLLLSLTTALGCRLPMSHHPIASSPAETVALILIGDFDSSEQAAVDPSYYSITLRHIPIWRSRSDGPWLYVEQAVATQPDKPYRQRIYHLVNTADGHVRSDVYSLPGDPLRFAEAQAHEFHTLTPDQLERRSGCSIYLTQSGSNRFEGSTQAQDCLSTLRGAAYATSEVDLTPTLLTTWDRGYDAAGEQVWGAKDGPYQFRRITPK
ncbi:MAG: chromophore lyase CpcT/CpeT [Planctomycetota bacterium]